MPQQPACIRNDLPVIDQIEEKDWLLSFPYESMKPFIRLLKEAGEDERVVSIRMTLYRVAKNSQIVEALIDAAENGKEVVVLVELRARFDEENNIEWSRRLEDAGCRIITVSTISKCIRNSVRSPTKKTARFVISRRLEPVIIMKRRRNYTQIYLL